MKALFLLFVVSSVSCAPQPLGPASKSGKSAPASSSIPSTQAAAMPGQCMGLIGAERDQCLRRFGSSGAGSTAPAAATGATGTGSSSSGMSSGSGAPSGSTSGSAPGSAGSK